MKDSKWPVSRCCYRLTELRVFAARVGWIVILLDHRRSRLTAERSPRIYRTEARCAGGGFAGKASLGEPLSFAIAPLSFYPKLQLNYRPPIDGGTRGRTLTEVWESTAEPLCCARYHQKRGDGALQDFRIARVWPDTFVGAETRRRLMRPCAAKRSAPLPLS